MRRRGNCDDNAVAERFFQLLKRERIGRQTYQTHDAARQDAFDYMEMFYNPTRKHTNNGMLSPVGYEAEQQRMNTAGGQQTRGTSGQYSGNRLRSRGVVESMFMVRYLNIEALADLYRAACKGRFQDGKRPGGLRARRCNISRPVQQFVALRAKIGANAPQIEENGKGE